MSFIASLTSIVPFASLRTLLEAAVGIVLLCAWRTRWKWNVRQLEQQRAQLEATVAARTHAYEEQALQADEASRMKSQFLANMSHQIRTPMSGILGTLDLALGTSLTREQREYIKLTKNCAESLLALLDEILDFSRMGSKSLAIEHEEFSLAYCLNSVRTTIMARFEHKVSLSIKIDENVPDRLVGDPYRIRQLLLKQLDGAAPAAPEKITIAVEAEETASFDAPRQEPVISLLFSVQHPVAAVRYYADSQKVGSLAANDGSAELRFELCKRLAGMMGGRFWMDSSKSTVSRACFTAELGVPDSHGRSEPSEASVKVDDQTSKESSKAIVDVLLAEDNRVNQLVTKRLLEQRGFQTHVVNNGREALELLSHADVDLIIMDMQMPEMDGYEATRRIREKERKTGRHIPIIALTATAMEGDRQKCLMAGTDAYIAKPFRSEQLYQRIDMLLAKNGLDPLNCAIDPV